MEDHTRWQVVAEYIGITRTEWDELPYRVQSEYYDMARAVRDGQRERARRDRP